MMAALELSSELQKDRQIIMPSLRKKLLEHFWERVGKKRCSIISKILEQTRPIMVVTSDRNQAFSEMFCRKSGEKQRWWTNSLCRKKRTSCFQSHFPASEDSSQRLLW